MNDLDKNINRIFKQKLNSYSETPPQDVWENIDAHLSQQKIKNRNFVYKIAASIAVIIAIGTSIFLTQNLPLENLNTNNKKIVNNNKLNNTINTNKKEILKQDKNHKLFVKENEQSIQTKEKNSKQKTIIKEVKENDFVVSNDIESIKALPIKIKQEKSSSLYHPYINKIIFNKIDDFGQNKIADNSVKKKRNRDFKFTIGGQFSPAYSYRHLGSSSNNNINRDYYNSVENGMLSFSGGLTVQLETNKRLSVQTGIYYASNGQQIKQVDAYSNIAYEQANMASPENTFSIANSVGEIKFKSPYVFVDQTNVRVDIASSNKMFFDNDNPNFNNLESKIIQSYNYIEIPFLLKYKLIDKNIDFNILGGLSTNFLVGNNVFLQYNGTKEKIGETENLQKINYSGTMGFGFEYAIFNSFKLKLEPTINYYLNSISSNSNIDTHPYSFAIFSGINYTF